MKPQNKAFLIALSAVLLLAVGSFFLEPVHAQNFVPGVHIMQVTIGASATPISAVDTPVSQLIFQNNAAHNMRIGDSTVSTSKGALLASGSPGGAVNFGAFGQRPLNLNQFYVAGTQGDVVDVIYIQ